MLPKCVTVKYIILHCRRVILKGVTLAAFSVTYVDIAVDFTRFRVLTATMARQSPNKRFQLYAAMVR